MQPTDRPSRWKTARAAALALAVIVVLAWQHLLLRSLRSENAALRAQVRRVGRLEDDGAELQRLRTLMAEPDRLRRDILELHRLRKEVEDLRAGRATADLDAETLASTNPTATPPSAPTEPPAVPLLEAGKPDWQYRGFDTPAATVETILWAGRENRVDVFLDSFIPEIRAEFEEAMEEIGVTPSLDAEDGPIAQATGLRVLSVKPNGAQDVEMTYVVQGWHDNKPFRQALRQTSAGWKFSGDPAEP